MTTERMPTGQYVLPSGRREMLGPWTKDKFGTWERWWSVHSAAAVGPNEGGWCWQARLPPPDDSAWIKGAHRFATREEAQAAADDELWNLLYARRRDTRIMRMLAELVGLNPDGPLTGERGPGVSRVLRDADGKTWSIGGPACVGPDEETAVAALYEVGLKFKLELQQLRQRILDGDCNEHDQCIPGSALACIEKRQGLLPGQLDEQDVPCDCPCHDL